MSYLRLDEDALWKVIKYLLNKIQMKVKLKHTVGLLNT